MFFYCLCSNTTWQEAGEVSEREQSLHVENIGGTYVSGDGIVFSCISEKSGRSSNGIPQLHDAIKCMIVRERERAQRVVAMEPYQW